MYMRIYEMELQKVKILVSYCFNTKKFSLAFSFFRCFVY